MALWKAWKQIIVEPAQFYKKLPSTVKYKEPSIFFLKISALLLAIWYVIILLFATVIVSFLHLLNVPILDKLASFGIGFILLILIASYPLLLFFNWGMLFVGTAITHLFVLLFGGKKKYVETYKVTAYASAPLIFSFIPLAGYIATIYTVVLQIIGIRVRHSLTLGKSIAAVLIPGGILLTIYLIFLITWGLI